jgi:membrane dipeptidase
MFIFDAHLDLAMNALEWNRDLTKSVYQIRESEKGMVDKPDRGNNTVSLDAMRKGNIGICVATQIAGIKNKINPNGWSSMEQAWAQTQGQLGWYKEMEKNGEMYHIYDLNTLDNQIENWQKETKKKPIGYILSLEGADSIVNIDYLEKSYMLGLRAIGPAHYGPGVYAYGTDSNGSIGQKGKELVKKIEELNLILDVTHLSDTSFWETIEIYNGNLWASHNNCRKFVNHNRQFSDDQIKEIIRRDGVIGVPLDAWMMVPNWIRGKSIPETMGVTLNQMIENIDHICQLSGNSNHVGIGTDLDGAFGVEQTPTDIDTIADLQKIPLMLKKIGFSESDVEKVMNQNFINFLKRVWK